jgi:hypothetical protein
MSSNNNYYSVAFQNGADTLYNFQRTANLQAIHPAGTVQYKTDFDRMRAKIGCNASLQGTALTDGYQNYLYSRFYSVTANPPSSNGPGNAGWSAQIGTPGSYDPVYFGDYDPRIGVQTNVGIVTSGYVYSLSNTTITFQTLTDDGIRVDFNGSNVINNFIAMAPSTTTSVACQLYAGKYHPLKATYYQGAGGMIFQLAYKIGSGPFTTSGQGVFYHNYNQL